jgi:hypothetical protein
MRMYMLFIAFAACSSSGTETLFVDAPNRPADAAPPPDPDGHYMLTMTWTGGNCGTVPAYTETFSVTKGGNGYVFTAETAESMTGGTDCTPAKCKMLTHEYWDMTDPPQDLQSSFTLASDGSITGTATLDVKSDIHGSTPCTETADVAGRRTM